MKRTWIKSFKQFETSGFTPNMVNEATTFQDMERFLHKSYKDNPTDDDGELAERAIMNPDFADVEDEDWAFDIALEIISGNFY